MQKEPTKTVQSPDPASSYGRERPEEEAGMGQVKAHHPPATPNKVADGQQQTVKNAQVSRQLNTHEVVNEAAGHRPTVDDK